MHPRKASRDISASERWISKKRRSWRMYKTTLSAKRERVRATGQMDASSFQALRRMGGPRWPTQCVLERDNGTNYTKSSLIWMCLPMHLREKSSESHLAEVMAKMKAHFLKSWARLRGRDQCIKRSMTGAGSQTEGTLREGGLLVKTPFTRQVMRG
jgi:hypothetical protein